MSLTRRRKSDGAVDWSGRTRFVSEQLKKPLRRRTPTVYFVNSMSDLFHESLKDWQIDKVFGAMWACLYGPVGGPGHVFQVLTKRAERMRDYMNAPDVRERWARAAGSMCEDGDGILDQTYYYDGPHPRIWLGVSAEDQQRADERIPHLLKTPAAVRFLSLEPLLGPVDLRPWLPDPAHRERLGASVPAALDLYDRDQIRWVIVGGESGAGARPCDVAWVESVVAQCRGAGVACFVKQLGARPVFHKPLERLEVFSKAYGGTRSYGPGEAEMVVTGGLKHKKGADMAEWPESLRVREMPAVRS